MSQIGRSLRLDLTVPGPLPLIGDPLALAGLDLDDVLDPVRRAPTLSLPNGQRVHRIALPHGDRVVRPLRQWGAIGFGCTDGELDVYVPPPAADDVIARMKASPSVARLRRADTRVDGSPAVLLRATILPGLLGAISLSMIGAIGMRCVGDDERDE